MDIKSGATYPASALSNFSPHPFEIDGVQCNSMEGFLQALKFKEPDMQKYVCTLVGFKAKMQGYNKNWQRDQTLYWQNIEYPRKSKKYQELLDRAYEALFTQNANAKKALLATNNATITHSIGKTKKNDTVLTQQEFCSRLMKIRKKLVLDDSLIY